MRRIFRAAFREFLPKVVFLFACFFLTLAASCSHSSSGGAGSGGEDFPDTENKFDARYASTPLDVSGQVLSDSGREVPEAQVSAVPWEGSATSAKAEVETDIEGKYRLPGVTRRSLLLRFHREGYYDEFVPVDLQRPLAEKLREVEPVALVRKKPGRVRLIVAGGIMFGRRFVDRDGDGVEGEDGDLIHPEARAEDSKRLLRFVREVLASGDLTAVSLDTAVTEDPVTFHPLKAEKLHSHPDTLAALSWAGVDAVNLGNQHVYDLLEPGMTDTLGFVAAAGLAGFGAGMSESAAKASTHQATVSGLPVALQGFNGIVPTFDSEGSVPWPPEFLLVARDEPLKGGSLELTEENLISFLQASAGTSLAVPFLHCSVPSSRLPSSGVRSKVKAAIQGGAGFVVAHDSHALQGIARLQGGPAGGIAFLSPGSLLHDGDAFEALRGYIGIVDVDQIGSEKPQVRGVRLIPFHREGYVPKLLCGAMAEDLGRHIGHLSKHLPPAADGSPAPDGLEGAVAFPSRGGVFVALDPSRYETTDFQESLQAEAGVPIPFPRKGGADFLAGLKTSAPSRCEYGREVLLHGDFEDLDVDDQAFEGEAWDQSPNRFIQNSVVRSGTAAMVLLRDWADSSSVSTWPRSPVGFPESSRLTLTGHLRGDGAGAVEISVRWYRRADSSEMERSIAHERPPGTYGWERFSLDLVPPAEAGSLRFYLRQYPPQKGEGRAFFDDTALVLWEGSAADASAGLEIETPNNWTWIRLKPRDGNLTTLAADLTHRQYAPRLVPEPPDDPEDPEDPDDPGDPGDPDDPDDPSDDGFLAREAEYDARYAAAGIQLGGDVKAAQASGGLAGVPGVQVSVVSWDASEGGPSATTDPEGRFALPALPRRPTLLRFHREGYYDELLPIDLRRPLEETILGAESVVLIPRKPGYMRFILGGDVMFGGRLADRDEDGVPGEPEDLIRPQSRLEDSKALLRFVRDVLSSADVTLVNLETAVTDDPATPHPYRGSPVWSHPEALRALAWAGVDAVGLANDHVYDYLDPGMRDTLENVTAVGGLGLFGAGMSATEAAAAVLEPPPGSVLPFAVQGFSGILPATTWPEGQGPWPEDLLYVARDEPIVKGGALELTEENLEAFLRGAAGSKLAVAAIHAGQGWEDSPSSEVRSMVKLAIREGAGLVLRQHPQTVGAVVSLDRQPGTAFAFLSLGRLLSDEDRFESFPSFLGMVDVERLAPDDHRVRRVRVIPLHSESFVPKLLCGAWAERLARHAGHLSTCWPAAAEGEESADGLRGAVVFPALGSAVVHFDPSQHVTVDSTESLTLAISEGTTGPFPFRRLEASDFLAAVKTSEPVACDIGRDLLLYGDFEDLDIDDASDEGDLWMRSQDRFIENSVVHGGAGAMVLMQEASRDGYLSTWNKSRVGFPQGSRLTLTGHVKGENAGKAQVLVRWYSRDDDAVLSTPTEFERSSGSYDWEPFALDLDPPPEAGTVRLYLRHHPPASGEGLCFFDDLALISWEKAGDDFGQDFLVETPNNFGWIRLRTEEASAGSLELTLTHRTYSCRPDFQWEGKPLEVDFRSSEEKFDEEYAATPIDVSGRVVDGSGAPLAGVEVSALGWGDSEVNSRAKATTGKKGRFALKGLARRSVILRFRRDGYYDEFLPVNLHRPLSKKTIGLGSTVLSPRSGCVRWLVGGDTFFGRRFVDLDEDGIQGEPGDLIRPGLRADDAKAVLRFMADVLASADFTMVNLESVVTDDPATPHPYKDYTFHSHPETLAGLTWAGVDAVSLGNDHVYDFLDPGVSDTLRFLGEAGLGSFGAGLNGTQALGSLLYSRVGETDIAVQGFNGILPTDFPTEIPSELKKYFLYVARSSPPKGGSLELSTKNIKAFLEEAGGMFSVPVIHTGSAYTEYPSPGMRSRCKAAIQNGAGFIAGHHPHTVHGVAQLEGKEGRSFAFLSLGDFVSDMETFETFQSCLGLVDVAETPEGRRFRKIQMIPFHIEGYVPRLTSGAWAGSLGRHAGHLSTCLPPAPSTEAPPDGLVGAVVFPSSQGAFVALDSSQYRTTEEEKTIKVRASGGATPPVRYARTKQADFLAAVRTASPASCEYGRELLHYGDFEDLDVDGEFHEGHFWAQSSSAILENKVVRTGVGAMALLRTPLDRAYVSTWPLYEIHFKGGSDLTLTGFRKGESAGRSQVLIQWYDGGGDVISTTVEHRRDPGTFDWERFTVDLVPPETAESLRFYLRQHPPDGGAKGEGPEGRVFFDDIALIQWEGRVDDASPGFALPQPNNWSWLRFRPLEGGAATIEASLTHKVFTPASP